MNRRTFARNVGLGAAGLASGSWNLYAQQKAKMGDVIVVLPGIMGSVLQKRGRDVWNLTGAALINALWTRGGNFKDLKIVGEDDPTKDDLGDGIVATRLFEDTHLIPGFWKIDGYTKLRNAIHSGFQVTPGENYFEFAYDWRRDCRSAANKLAREAHSWLKRWRDSRGPRDAKLILVAHSMGGLVARYYLECMEGWKNTRHLVTFGTPFRGSLNAVNTLCNGIKL